MTARRERVDGGLGRARGVVALRRVGVAGRGDPVVVVRRLRAAGEGEDRGEREPDGSHGKGEPTPLAGGLSRRG